MYNCNKNSVMTLDFGCVPVRKTHTDGKHLQDIELTDNGTAEAFAEIRSDYRTNQPFAVLFDENWNQLYCDEKQKENDI